jgi:hypothetical protein
MSVRMRDLLMHELGALRYEPTDKRIRATPAARACRRSPSRRRATCWSSRRCRCATTSRPRTCGPTSSSRAVTGRIAFFNERVDIVVDGERAERPVTPWSRR